MFTVGPRSGQPGALKAIKRTLRKVVRALRGTAAPLRMIDYRRRDGGRFLRAHLHG